MGSAFASSREFREVMDRVFAMMDEDSAMGPQLRDADVPQRFEFDDVDWQPKVRMAMSSETANKYFQGKENIAVALARRRIKSGGDVKAALSLMPITKPVFARYRAMLEAEYPHLVV